MTMIVEFNTTVGDITGDTDIRFLAKDFVMFKIGKSIHFNFTFCSGSKFSAISLQYTQTNLGFPVGIAKSMCHDVQLFDFRLTVFIEFAEFSN